MPDLGREFSPAGADCGYRAPLAPRLARPSRWYRAIRLAAVRCARVWERRDGCRRRRNHSSGDRTRDDDREGVSFGVDGDAHAAISRWMTQRKAQRRRSAAGNCFPPASGNWRSSRSQPPQAIDATGGKAVGRDAFGAGSGIGGLKFSTPTPRCRPPSRPPGRAGGEVSRLLGAEPDERAAGGCGIERTDAAANGYPGVKGSAAEDIASPKRGRDSGRASSHLRRNNPSCPCVL